MKNVPGLKTSKNDSPKTPGGISKSLLTPCRRVGLSRNFRKSGASPFQSPLASKTEEKQEKIDSRKRKQSLEDTPQTPVNDDGDTSQEVIQTPTRNVVLPRRKKSKTLLASLSNNLEETEELCHDKLSNTPTELLGSELKEVSTPKRLKSKSKSKHTTPNNLNADISLTDSKENVDKNTNNLCMEVKENTESIPCVKEKRPNNLAKECIVVIQKKVFKKELKENVSDSKEGCKNSSLVTKEPVSQAVLDSDSDDLPLICLNSNTKNKETKDPPYNDQDEDFAPTKPIITANLEKACSKSKLKASSLGKTKTNNKTESVQVHSKLKNTQDSDDDDDFETKKTILIRKTYDKIVKPQKAKSTGSITQKDIDDLKARIEVKKKMLVARAMQDDTKELRDLIKKWQRGCQQALMELMDLMKSKSQDKNMDYSEMLQTLKIPASLVGYDSDNDCFVTPDDNSIVLSCL